LHVTDDGVVFDPPGQLSSWLAIPADTVLGAGCH
jgi:hypothetical protein